MVRVSKTVPYDLGKEITEVGRGATGLGIFANSFMAESAVDVCNIF